MKTKQNPIKGNLEIEMEEDEDLDDDGANNKTGAKNSQPTVDDKDRDQKIVASGQGKATQTLSTESYSEDEEYQEPDFDAYKPAENITHSPASNAEAIDMALLFGTPVESVVEQKEAQNLQREEDPDLEALFRDEPASSATNQYDDDYAADYSHEEMGYQEFPASNEAMTSSGKTNKEKQTEAIPKKVEKGKANVEKKPEQSKPVAANPNQKKAAKIQPEATGADDFNNEDLFAALMGTSKTKPKASEIKPKETTKADATEIEGLFSKVQKPSDGDQSGRAELILNRLKKLPVEYLEARQGGITKVIGMGLKNTKLELNECVSVLKEAGLLVLIDGYETALDSTGKPKSRYFLVKAELLNGK
jgi:hypothetical protein